MVDFNTENKPFRILPQPTDVSCGPTCLQGVYDYYDDFVPLEEVINDVKQVKGGGTLAVMLGNHALKRGYRATIYTYNLQVFDPTWFDQPVNLTEKLTEQASFKSGNKLHRATRAYLRFLKSGGEIRFEELKPSLIRRILSENHPILTGLSATYLYMTAREIAETNAYHDTKGEPVGHFVVICDYDQQERKVLIADPLNPNPIDTESQYYAVDVQRVVNAILLGIVTYDANLLVIQPK